MNVSLALLTVIVISTSRKGNAYSDPTCILISLMLLGVPAGFALATFVDPPSGSTIARLEGAMNAVTLACNVTLSDGLTQTFTEWFVRNLRGNDALQIINNNFFPEVFSVGGDPLPTDPTRTFRNQLILLNFTAELDGTTIFCGTGGIGNREQAKFYLRVYSKLSGHGTKKRYIASTTIIASYMLVISMYHIHGLSFAGYKIHCDSTNGTIGGFWEDGPL